MPTAAAPSHVSQKFAFWNHVTRSSTNVAKPLKTAKTRRLVVGGALVEEPRLEASSFCESPFHSIPAGHG